MIGMFKRRYKKVTYKGYIYSGSSSLPTCDEYDPVGNTWTNKLDALAPARHYLAASTIGV